MKGWNSTLVTNWWWRVEWMWEDWKIQESGEHGRRGREWRWKRKKIRINRREGVDVCACSRFEGGGWRMEAEWETDRHDGVSDRPSLCWVLKPGALRQLWYGWRTTLALLRRAVGGEALRDCIHIVKNSRRGRLCKQASFTCRRLRRALLIGDGFLHEGNKVFVLCFFFFLLQVTKSEK